jgi:hypothetical protein
MVYDQEQTYLVTTTTSDHGPVLARFELKEDVTLSTNDVIGKMSWVQLLTQIQLWII